MSCGLTSIPLLWKPQQPTAAAIQNRAPSNVLVADSTKRKKAGPHSATV